jgi:hypothetical protein
MKKLYVFSFLLTLGNLVLASDQKPNVIYILADDLGMVRWDTMDKN